MPALITGVAGQDGVWLSRSLLQHGTPVVGTIAPGRAPGVYLDGVEVVTLDVRDRAGFAELLERVRPETVHNLAAFSSIGASWATPELLPAINTDAVEGMLAELVSFRDRHGWAPRFFQASSADMYGAPLADPRDETTPMTPVSPYARSKHAAHQAVAEYRAKHELFAASGILFNHESVLRPLRFVTRKICRGAAEIALGRAESLTLGTVDIRRDWGSAADFAAAMRLVLATDEPDDFVIATGVSRPLASVVDLAFAAAGVDDPWSYVVQDPELVRPADVPDLVGDPAKAGAVLGWRPATRFEDEVATMVRVDLARLRTGVEDDPAYLSGA